MIKVLAQLKSQYNLVYSVSAMMIPINALRKKAKTQPNRLQFNQGQKLTKNKQQKHQPTLTSEVIMNLIRLSVKCS